MAGATQPPSAGPAVPPLSLEEVARLFPQLEIIRLIGVGGMGAVYQARQPALDRHVALKLLHTPPANDPGFAERFAQEARALAKLNHPNIVALHEFGQAGGRPYFLMEFVDGVNLRQLQQAGRLSPREALSIVPQVCDALQYAHDEGIVHRDIKPENVLIDRKGRVKVADFGLAKLMGRETAATRLTGAGHVMGTPHYMAPEQVEHPLEVDHRADIFSLGVVFYELLTGELPLGKFPLPSKKVRIDVRLDEVVLRALEKEPSLRYGQASELKTRVETITRTPEKAEATEKTGAASLSTGNEEKERSIKGWAWQFIPLVAVLLAFFNPWGSRAWYWFAAACAVLAVLPGFRRRLRPDSVNTPLPPSPGGRKRKIWFTLWVLLTAGVVLLGVRVFVFAAYRVPTSAVSPEIPRGSLVFVFKLVRHFAPADIIAYNFSAHEIRVGRVVREDAVKGVVHIERRGETPQQVPADAIIGKVIFNTRAAAVTEVFRDVPLPTDAKPTQDRAKAASTFGPVTELVVAGALDLDTGRMAPIDANTGQIAALPESIKRMDDLAGSIYETVLWTVQEGLDVYVDSSEFAGLDLRVVEQTPDQWDRLTAAQAASLLDAVMTKAPHYAKLKAAENTTYVFQTREGARGILQIVGRPDDKGLKLRYKRLQAGSEPPAAAQAWLALMDGGRYAESWDAAAESFHAAVTSAEWSAEAEKIRRPLGDVISRAFAKTQRTKTFPGMPDGSYWIAEFDTKFAGLKSAAEVVVFSLEKDGQWRAISYLIRPRSETEQAVVVAARAWLASIDDGRYAESWDHASALFREAPLTREKWVAALESVRRPLGDLVFRTVNATRLVSTLPGAPAGRYVVMQFDASFAEDKSAVETVTFMQEKDGQWRAAGYFIK
jgi:hypothetical protein